MSERNIGESSPVELSPDYLRKARENAEVLLQPMPKIRIQDPLLDILRRIAEEDL